MKSLFRNALLTLAAALAGFSPAAAAECGADKLGVARVQKVGTEGGLDVGWKTYRDTIPLADHEVILTFDDGPDPATTPAVLEALKAQCVRATFFAIGRNADEYPKLTRREVEEGHNVAFHTYTHPQPTLRFMAPAVARADILKGVIAVERAAYGQDFANGDPDDLSKIKMHAPFFRFPGFADTPDLRAWFAKNNVAIFGVDLWASDWIQMTPDQELKLVFSRLDRARKGMLLLHDNRPWTAQMLPRFLEELKARGYRVVQIEAGPGRGPTEAAPAGWRSETERTVNSLKPRLDGGPARTGTSFAVKPAPQD
jgi:peptidoglycan-N-acetylglucosamine deacetylase